MQSKWTWHLYLSSAAYSDMFLEGCEFTFDNTMVGFASEINAHLQS